MFLSRVSTPHQTFPQQERGRMMVQIGLQRKEESAAAINKCTVCWMTKVRAVFVEVESRDAIDTTERQRQNRPA